MKCKKCGNEFEGNFCPICGSGTDGQENSPQQNPAQNTAAPLNNEKPLKKPFYKRWWFILLIIVAVIFILIKILDGGSSDTKTDIIPQNDKTVSESVVSETPSQETPVQETPVEEKIEQTGGIGTEFKSAMDSYESFMTEYVDYMKKYKANPSDISLLSEYSKYVSKYADMCKEFDKWKDKQLNPDEMAYYVDVQARVSKKLLEVAQ